MLLYFVCMCVNYPFKSLLFPLRCPMNSSDEQMDFTIREVHLMDS